MHNTLIVVSRFISKASTVPIIESEVRALLPVIEILKKDLPLLCSD